MAVSLTMNSLSFYEPMRKNWFIVQFDSSLGNGTDGDALTIACKTCDIPSLTTTENVIDRLNDKVYTPAKSEYGTISIVFNEYIQETSGGQSGDQGEGNYRKSAGELLYAWQQQVHNVKSGVQGAKKQIAHNIAIVQIDGAGNAVRVWNVYKAWPTQIQFDQLDSSDGSMQTVTATFRFDWAEQKDATITIGTGVGDNNPGVLNSGDFS